MPKVKTHRAAKKRLKLTANGKVKKRSAFTSHLLSNRSAKTKRQLRKNNIVATCEEKRIKVLLTGR
ncbi:MAG: 50S ribosomal protein L35 [Candidatus Cloacimonadota bacterium]|nr:MAG: 50S ribosomal protein L35 [Candidatus Cloacimonadota bacterium]PIE78124.1 MAG: 50S ribosomal protein L35 [Candidatus Delongbacteria bacterium]